MLTKFIKKLLKYLSNLIGNSYFKIAIYILLIIVFIIFLCEIYLICMYPSILNTESGNVIEVHTYSLTEFEHTQFTRIYGKEPFLINNATCKILNIEQIGLIFHKHDMYTITCIEYKSDGSHNLTRYKEIIQFDDVKHYNITID